MKLKKAISVLLCFLMVATVFAACKSVKKISTDTGTATETATGTVKGTESATAEKTDSETKSGSETSSRTETVPGTSNDTESETLRNIESETEKNTETAPVTSRDTEPETSKDTEKITEEVVDPTEMIVFAERGQTPEFKIIYGLSNSEDASNDFGVDIRKAIKEKTGVELKMGIDDSIGGEVNCEILINSMKREAGKTVYDSLNDGEFTIVFRKTGGKKYIIIAFKGAKARIAARNTFINEFVNCEDRDACMMLAGTEIKKTPNWEDIAGTSVSYPITDSEIVSLYVTRRIDLRSDAFAHKIRDPSVIYEDGVFYMYYTTFTSNKGPASWIVRTATSLDGDWSVPKTVLRLSDLSNKYGITAFKNDYNWAPEIHKYNGKYYIFTTYWCESPEHDSPSSHSYNGTNLTGHLASIILMSDKLTGPFEPISVDGNGNLGHSSPAGWDTIDLTFYVDENGQPWGIFSRDWASMPDTVGGIYAVKLSSDLTEFVSEPILLLSGKNTTPFIDKGCTDGCYMYRTKGGELLMLWSPLVRDSNGYFMYTVAVARSKSGNIEGPWVLDSELLYEKSMYKGMDGGHPALFTDGNGQLWMAIHAPNYSPEAPTFIPLCEIDNKLVWGLTAKPEK